eukprot:CAMPEP_0177602702 /NCGR_PEP_ID=MMETSP0419_2-20121207/15039_1 /TAXON_ID=582737 /ORGANISM="Tetraselmis sp., Strain GSL018" /LENGTH=419 /DNA_ID=CAMNT_0019096263 /DNA_START=20 /DNA_END=1279 /DNA_ORIENTATION=-
MKLPPGHVPGVGVQQATAYGGFGEKLLRSLGWEKGDGLGRNRQGISQAIEVKKKEDNSGVGGSVRYDWENKWWEAAFNASVERIQEDSDSDSDDSDDEPQPPSLQQALRRNRDGTFASASAEELHLLSTLSKDERGWAGRFSGREGKMERIRRQEAEAAAKAREALGLEDRGPSKTAVNATKSSLKRKAASPDPPERSPSTAAEKPKKRKELGRRQGTESEAARDPLSGSDAVSPSVPDTDGTLPLVRGDWWGSKYFVSGGLLGGLDCEESARQRKQFCEDDQENLYHRTHSVKAAGRQGIGVRGSEIKIAGGKFQGTRVKFDDAEDEAGPGDDVASPDSGSALEGLKWKKMILRELQGAPSGAMKLKRLQKRVAAAAAAKLGGEAARNLCRDTVRRLVMQKIESSSKFVLERKLVRCA